MQTVDIPTGRISLFDSGPQAERPVVLLVHGFPLDHSMWKSQLEPLAAHARVIAVDLRGFGQSSVPDGSLTMDACADDLAYVLDALQVSEPVVLCGLSMGGYVAWQFERLHGRRLAGLILCDTRAAADSAEVLEARHAMAERILEEGMEPLVEMMGDHLCSRQTREQRPEVQEELLRMIRRADRQGAAAALRGMAARRDSTGRVRKISLPTLVVVGSDDVISPVHEMRSIAEELPRGRLVVVPDAGHLAPMERPEIVNPEIITFLSDELPADG